jgi:hypothetical protein
VLAPQAAALHLRRPEMGEVIRLNKPMTKVELIEHLEADHSEVPGVKSRPLDRHPKAVLLDMHRLIHLGLGR